MFFSTYFYLLLNIIIFENYSDDLLRVNSFTELFLRIIVNYFLTSKRYIR